MILDTCIIIDFLRGRPEAAVYLAALSVKPAISTITLTEIYAGLKSQKSELVVRGFFRDCRVLGITQPIAEQAGVLLRHYKASHGVDPPDALIAATAEHHGLTLATLNVKHFPMFRKLKPAY